MPLRNELDRVDFVTGPMVANAEAVANRGQVPKVHRPNALSQVAIKSDLAENAMMDALSAVMWIRK